MLLGPGFALLMVGVVAATVNGVLLGRFLMTPGSELEHARWQVQEFRNQQLDLQARAAENDPAPADPPDTSALEEDIAQAWATRVIPFHVAGFLCGVATACGGLATLTGRFYPLALLGCVTAILNLNYLCCVPGFAAGAWAGLMLVRDDGRQHFRRS
jgi:hypothetical protein